MPNRTEPRPAAAASKKAAGRKPGPFKLGEVTVPPGSRVTVDLPLSLLSNHTPMTLPVQVVHGRKAGPRLFVSAAVHGDEINGVEIIRRLLTLPTLKTLRGTLIAVPIVNAYGFIAHTRYLPDRRDLNRSFPGSAKGSLAAQLAHQFMTQVVSQCTHGVDLHTGAIHRTNLPQIRGDVSDPEVRRLASAFGAPVVLNAALRDGSLRQAAREAGIPMLLYEAGEALRFDDFAVRAGVKGLVQVMRALGMIRRVKTKPPPAEPVFVDTSFWVRAPAGGILRTPCSLGARVKTGDRLGVVSDPFGEAEFDVEARHGGIVIGRTNLPVVNQGDALFHIARVHDAESAAESVGAFQDDLEQDALLDSMDLI